MLLVRLRAHQGAGSRVIQWSDHCACLVQRVSSRIGEGAGKRFEPCDHGGVSRSQRGFPLRVALLSIIASLATVAAYLGVTGGMAALNLSSAREHATRAQADYQSGNLADLVDQVGELRVDLMEAQHWVSAPVWDLAAKTPGAGTSIDSLRRLVEAGGELAQAGAQFEGVAREFIGAGSTAVGKPIPKQVLTSLGPALRQLADAAQVALAQVAQVDPASLPGPLGRKFGAVVAQINALLPPLVALAAPADALVALLGPDGPKQWLIAMQNGGESRGTGGLVGSFAAVTVNRGAFAVDRVGSNEDLTAKADPALLPKPSQDLWGPARLAEIYGVNLSPNFPFAGELLSSLWQRQSGKTPDAVVATDQRTTADLIGAVGGVSVDGIALTGANAYEFLTVGVYERFPNVKAKDAFVIKLIGGLFEKLTSGTVPAMKLLPVLVDATTRRALLVWAAQPQSQRQLEASAIAGVVPDQDGPFAMAVINNNAGNKMDTFLHTSVTYRQGECVSGGRRSTLTINLHNDPPAHLPPYVDQRVDRGAAGAASATGDGSNRLRVAAYLPKGAFLAKATPTQLFTGEERSHPVAMFGVELQRGERKAITVEFTEFGGAELMNAAPQVLAQPMLNPQQLQVTEGPRCQ